MPSIPTWVTTGLLIFAALYTIVQAVRLYLPVYFWTFDRNATRGRAILAVCAKDRIGPEDEPRDGVRTDVVYRNEETGGEFSVFGRELERDKKLILEVEE